MVVLCPISYSLDSLSPSRLASGASTASSAAVPNWIQCFQWVCNMIRHGCTQPCSKCRIHHWKSFAAMPIIQIFPRYYPKLSWAGCWWSTGSAPEWGTSGFRNENNFLDEEQYFLAHSMCLKTWKSIEKKSNMTTFTLNFRAKKQLHNMVGHYNETFFCNFQLVSMVSHFF